MPTATLWAWCAALCRLVSESRGAYNFGGLRDLLHNVDLALQLFRVGRRGIDGDEFHGHHLHGPLVEARAHRTESPARAVVDTRQA